MVKTMISMIVKIQQDRDGYYIRVPAAYVRKQTLAAGKTYLITLSPAGEEQHGEVVAE
jgi:hypothetical protein